MSLRKILLLAFCLGILSCCKIEDIKPENDEIIGEKILIKINMPDDVSTKILYKDDKVGSGESSLLWEDGDKIAIVGSDGSTFQKNELTLKTGANTNNATFSGESITGVDKYFIYYPSTVEVDAKNGDGSLNFDGQIQSGNNNSGHLRDYIFLASDKEVSLIGGQTFTLNIKSCIAKFVLENIPSDIGTINKLIWSVETINGTKSITLVFDKSNPINTSSLTAYIGFMPSEMSIKEGGKYSVELVGTTKTYIAEKTSTAGKSYVAGKRYTAELGSFAEVGSLYYRYGYEGLTDEDKSIYDYMVKEMLNTNAHEEHNSYQKNIIFDFSKINRTDLMYYSQEKLSKLQGIILKINADMPEMFLNTTEVPRPDNEKWKLRVSKDYSESYNSYMGKITAVANEICSGVEANVNEFDKLKYIHDRFLPITYSRDNGNRDNIIGGLYDKRALCEGMAHSMQYLCQKIGLKAIYIEGNCVSMGGLHAWIYVSINNKWYLLDPTVDNGMAGNEVAGYNAFLLGENDVKGNYDLSFAVYPNLPKLSLTNCPGSDELRKKN